jgi:hypothetical protein
MTTTTTPRYNTMWITEHFSFSNQWRDLNNGHKWWFSQSTTQTFIRYIPLHRFLTLIAQEKIKEEENGREIWNGVVPTSFSFFFSIGNLRALTTLDTRREREREEDVDYNIYLPPDWKHLIMHVVCVVPVMILSRCSWPSSKSSTHLHQTGSCRGDCRRDVGRERDENCNNFNLDKKLAWHPSRDAPRHQP